MFKIKDKKAFGFFLLAGVVLWQFGACISNLCTDEHIMLLTRNNPVVSFVFTTNTGGAFSLFKGFVGFLIAFSVLALFLTMVYVYKKIGFEEKFKIIAAVLFFAGILGNLVERVKFGYVIDYIRLNFVDFAIFNAFDVMINLGVFIFVINTIYDEFLLKKGQKNDNN